MIENDKKSWLERVDEKSGWMRWIYNLMMSVDENMTEMDKKKTKAWMKQVDDWGGWRWGINKKDDKGGRING